MVPWSTEQVSRNVSRVILKANGIFEQRFLLTGDRHWDNPMSLWDLQKEHLNRALEHKAGVIDVGDFFCAMQGKYDKRSNKDDLRPEHKKGDYLDSLVNTADKFFSKWANSFITIAMGNHDTSILKKHETSLINRLTEKMRLRGSKVYNGGYSGWVHFLIGNQSVKLHYDHGYGGGGPVTRDVIQTNRRAVYLPDADIVISGHTHDQWSVPIQRVRFNDKSEISQDEQLHVKIPTYKEEYKDGFDGFHIETGRCPKPIGAYWLKLFRESKKGPVLFDVERAR